MYKPPFTASSYNGVKICTAVFLYVCKLNKYIFLNMVHKGDHILYSLIGLILLHYIQNCSTKQPMVANITIIH